MPLYLLRAYAHMLPEIQAQETLRAIFEGRVAGSGQMKPRDVRQAIRKVEADAQMDRRRPANPSTLRAAGIKVEHRTTRKG